MPRKSQDVTDAELAVLQVLWERPTATIRELTDVLYPDGAASEYATVKKLLARLEVKGCVQRDRSGTVHVFAAAIGRDDLVGRRLHEMAETLCEGSWTPLLTNLAEVRGLTGRQQRLLNELIDELAKNPPKKELSQGNKGSKTRSGLENPR